MSVDYFDRFISGFISYGSVTVTRPDGSSRRYGTAKDPHVAVKIHDRKTERRLLLRPTLAVGEAYTDGSLTIESGNLRDLLDILLKSQRNAFPKGVWGSIKRKLKTARFYPEMFNNIRRSRRNVQHHYDIGNDLYKLFLDRDMQYSCAYFREPNLSLEDAQFAKKEHLAKKLLLQPGMRVLDIGSGWGGLAIHLARHYGVQVTGVTLSKEQHAVSVRRAAELGLSGRVNFEIQDYRETAGQYDRIVSVGMFEHIGRPFFNEFFEHLSRLLKDEGVAVLHTIGRMTPPEPINIWMHRYIFPGGYLPALSELAPILEKLGLMLTDFENWRRHYAETLRHWDARFQEHRPEVTALYDERFCRMWELYLQSCERSFEHQGLCVFQLQLAKSMDAVPLTRDYMYRAAETMELPGVAVIGHVHSSQTARHIAR